MELSNLTTEQIKTTLLAASGYSDGETAKTLKEVEDETAVRWRPQHDWHDIKAIFAADTDPNKRWIFLVTDGNKTITLRNTELGGAYYRTSDGVAYTGTGNFTHTWDTTKDKPCARGYKTRYVTVYNATRNIVCDVSKTDAVYCYLGDCNATKIAGNGTWTDVGANTILEAVECGEQTTASANALAAYAFNACHSLVFVKIPKDITNIGTGAFRSCFSLASVNIPESVTDLGNNAFLDCFSLKSVVVPENVTVLVNSVFKNCHALASVNIPKNLTSIGDGAFYACRSLTRIDIPEKVTVVDTFAFCYCSSLGLVRISGNPASVGNTCFQKCNSLTTLTIGPGRIIPSVDISASNKLSIDGLVKLFDDLGDNTGNPPVTITIGEVNKAKLTASELAVAENKNYVIA